MDVEDHSYQKKHTRSSRALVVVILVWLAVTVLGFLRVEDLVNENQHRIKEIAAIQRKLAQLETRRNVSLVTVICKEQNAVKRTVRVLLAAEIKEKEHNDLRRRIALRQSLHALRDTNCMSLGKVK